MNEPCFNCNKKYKCDAQRMACAEFRYFVNTGYTSVTQNRMPSREIYVEVFYTDPSLTTRPSVAKRMGR